MLRANHLSIVWNVDQNFKRSHYFKIDFYEFATDGYCANGYAAPNTIRDSVFGCYDTCRRDAKIDYFAYDFVDKTCSCYDSESCPRETGSSGNYKSFKILLRGNIISIDVAVSHFERIKNENIRKRINTLNKRQTKYYNFFSGRPLGSGYPLIARPHMLITMDQMG